MTTFRYHMVRWRTHRSRWPKRIRQALVGVALFASSMVGFWMLMGACNSSMSGQ